MKIIFFDGGMLFEINKKYSDYGQNAVLYDQELIKNLHKGYSKMGCNFITTCNYCFTPKKMDNWIELTEISINLIQECGGKIFGSVPPLFKSYKIEVLDDDFYYYYNKLIDILINKVDFYLLETCVDYNQVNEIIKIIKKKDMNSKIIVSIYPNEENSKNIDNYLNLDIKGLFINCCSFKDMINFYNLNLKSKDFKNKKFGFYCNKIDEKKYSKELNIEKLQDFYDKKIDNISEIKQFLKTLPFDEIYIGGCCGYGIDEMKKLINNLKN